MSVTLQFVNRGPADDENLICSHCGKEADMLLVLKLTGTVHDAWIGHCETCVKQFAVGFENARKKVNHGPTKEV